MNNLNPQKNFYNDRFCDFISEQPECGNIDGSFSFFSRFEICKTSLILDVGTYIGSFPARIYESGWHNVFGVDIGDNSIRYGIQKYPAIKDKLISYNGAELPFNDMSIDVVTMFNVIEHVPDLGTFIHEVSRVMKKDAILLIQTPNKPVDIIYETLKYRSFKWRKSHCSLQTSNSLKKLLEEKGFKDIEFRKLDLNSDYYRAKVKKYCGTLAASAIPLLNYLPSKIYPTLSASARKK